MMMSACCDVSKVRIFVSTPLPSPAGLAETKIQHLAYSKPIRMRQAYVVVTDWPWDERSGWLARRNIRFFDIFSLNCWEDWSQNARCFLLRSFSTRWGGVNIATGTASRACLSDTTPIIASAIFLVSVLRWWSLFDRHRYKPKKKNTQTGWGGKAHTKRYFGYLPSNLQNVLHPSNLQLVMKRETVWTVSIPSRRHH